MSSASGIIVPPEYTIQRYPPSYLDIFLDTTIVDFVFKQRLNEEPSPFGLDYSLNNSNIHDRTGSPLKLELADESFSDQLKLQAEIKSFDLWAASEELHVPVPRADAIKYMNEYNFSKPKKLDDVWVWFLVDSNPLALVGQLIENNTWYNGTVKIEKPLTYEDINLNDLMKNHKQSFNVKNDVSIDIISTYNLLRTISAQNDNTNISLKIQWKNLTLTEPLGFAESTLTQQLTVGQDCCDTKNFWNELCLVQKLYNIILKNQNTSYSLLHNIQMPSESINDKPLLDEIQVALRQTLDFESKSDEHSLSYFPISFDMVSKRTTLNFCDMLWSVLKDSSTYMELLNCLNCVFSEVGHGNVNLKLPKECNTRLGTLLSDVKSQRAAIPCLTGLQPLELLLEIGVDKLCQDYIYFYKICKLRNKPLPFYDIPADKSKGVKEMNIKPRLTSMHGQVRSSQENLISSAFQNSRFDTREYNHKFKILARAHVIIEYLALSNRALSFDLGVLRDLHEQLYNIVFCGTNPDYKAPTGLEDLMKNKTQSISVPIDPRSIESLISKKNPSSLKVTFSSENNVKKIVEKYHFSDKCIFPPNIDHSIFKESKMQKEDRVYYVTHYIKQSIPIN